MRMYNDRVDVLPDTDVEVRKSPATAFITELPRGPTRWRGTIYS